MIVIYSDGTKCYYCKIIKEEGDKYIVESEYGEKIRASKMNIKKSFKELTNQEIYELLINKAALSLDDILSLGYGIPHKLTNNFKLMNNDLIDFLIYKEKKNNEYLKKFKDIKGDVLRLEVEEEEEDDWIEWDKMMSLSI